MLGINLSNQRANYSFIAITLSLILLGSGFLGFIPYVMADEDDDKKEKLKAKLKDLLEKIKAKIKQKNHDDSCKGNHYGDICDKKRPSIGIKKPGSGDKLPAGVITFEIKAKDKQTGIKMVELSINNGPFQPVPFISGDKYELDVGLTPGKYKATAKATDNAGNFKLDRVSFRVV